MKNLINHKVHAVLNHVGLNKTKAALRYWTVWNDSMIMILWATVSIAATYFVSDGLAWSLIPKFVGITLGMLFVMFAYEKISLKFLNIQYSLIPGFWSKRKKAIIALNEFGTLLENKENQFVILDFFSECFSKSPVKREKIQNLKEVFKQEYKSNYDNLIMFNIINNLYTEYKDHEYETQLTTYKEKKELPEKERESGFDFQ